MVESKLPIKTFIYGRGTHGIKADIGALESIKGLHWWTDNKKINADGLIDYKELFFTTEQISEEARIANNLIDLGPTMVSLFYVSEIIDGKQYIYIADSLDGDVLPLYPLSWVGAKINLIKKREKNKLYTADFDQTKLLTTMFPGSYEYLGRFTRKNAIKYGITMRKPDEDAKNSDYVKKCFEKFNKITDITEKTSKGYTPMSHIPLPGMPMLRIPKPIATIEALIRENQDFDDEVRLARH